MLRQEPAMSGLGQRETSRPDGAVPYLKVCPPQDRQEKRHQKQKIPTTFEVRKNRMPTNRKAVPDH